MAWNVSVEKGDLSLLIKSLPLSQHAFGSSFSYTSFWNLVWSYLTVVFIARDVIIHMYVKDGKILVNALTKLYIDWFINVIKCSLPSPNSLLGAIHPNLATIDKFLLLI